MKRACDDRRRARDRGKGVLAVDAGCQGPIIVWHTAATPGRPIDACLRYIAAPPIRRLRDEPGGFTRGAATRPPHGNTSLNLLAYGHSDGDTATADLTTEELLSGGRLTAGVVRVGDTVRRPSKCSSRFTEKLLGRLAATGFEGAPRYLGKDAQSRDMLSFIEGWVPAKFQHFSNAQIYDGGALLRAYHDSTRGSALAGGSPVVCHNDPGPNNVVFRNGMPAAFIDFDLAAPGDPLEDIGYAVWTWCVSSKPERGPVQGQAVQVRLFADAYGLCAADRLLVVEAMLERQRRNIHFWELHLSSADPALPATGQQIHDRINWSCREMEFTRRNAGAFAAALTR